MFVVEVFNFNFRGQPKGDGNIKGGNQMETKRSSMPNFWLSTFPTDGDDTDRTLGGDRSRQY